MSWQDTAIFTGGMTMMSPGRSLCFLLDGVLQRLNAGLPMRIAGCVYYECDQLGKLAESFVVELDDYLESQMPKPDHPEILSELKQLRTIHQKIERTIRDSHGSSMSGAEMVQVDRGVSPNLFGTAAVRVSEYVRKRCR